MEKFRNKLYKVLLVSIFVALLADITHTQLSSAKTISIKNSVVEVVVEEVPVGDPINLSVVEPVGDKEIIQKTAGDIGVDWKILYAIYQKESGGNCKAIGDRHLKNPSFGCFQINIGYHPTVSFEQASDLEWSARWTANRLKRFENMGRDEQIRSHNGLVADMSNSWYVEDVKEIMATL